MTSSEYQRAWRLSHPKKCAEYTKRYRSKNPEKYKARLIKWQSKNRAHIFQRTKAWAKANRERVCLASKRWRENHPEKAKQVRRNWRIRNKEKVNSNYRLRCSKDLQFKVSRRLRSRLYSVLKRKAHRKFSTTIQLLGCPVQFLIGHLEARFKPGMNWENYGKVWEIDHKIPCAFFDLSQESQQRACFNYQNLQPLFVFENRQKRCKLI